jgi:hypothetical protein
VRRFGFTGISDLSTAACAEIDQLTVLHYDTIARVTARPTMRVVPAGSVP